MKTRLTVLAALLGLMAAAAFGASAEAVRLSGTIPFEFAVGDRTMPAGEYTLAPTDALPGGWVITGEAAPAGMFVATKAGEVKSVQEPARLVFSRYGDRYFLTQIWTSASDHVVQLRVSKTERAVAREKGSRGTATVAMR